MSASEKLKALSGLSFEHQGKVLDDALPQIVAVVEAAEAFEIDQHPTITKATIWTKLGAALAALDQALSGDES